MRTLVPTLALAALAACGAGPEHRPLRVAVGILPHAYLVERLAGPRVEVTTLVLPGESPATYQPTDAQVSEVLQARILFRTGVPFENGKWFRTVAGGGLRVVDLRQGIELRRMEEHGHDHGEEGADPHIWLSPALLERQAATIAGALGQLDPGLDAASEANLAALREELGRLHEELADLLAPHRGKRVYVYHPAWGYLCDAYGLEQVAVEIEGKEPSDAELTRFQQLARQDRIRVLFVQPQIAGQSARVVARALGAEVVELDPLARDPFASLRAAARAFAEACR